MTEEERAVRKIFLESPRALDDWNRLVRAVGVYRAGWLAKMNDRDDTVTDPNEDKNIRFNCLPDRLCLYLYKDIDGEPGKLLGQSIPNDGLEFFSDNGDESWIENFEKAVENGMGFKVPLPNDTNSFKKLVVVGVRNETPTKSASDLAELFESHQYTRDFRILEYGSPTNNTTSTNSLHSAKHFFNAEDTYAFSRKKEEENPLNVLGGTLSGNILDPADNVHVDLFSPRELQQSYDAVKSDSQMVLPSLNFGQRLTEAFGINSSLFGNVPGEDLSESKVAALIHRLGWFSLGGTTLERLVPHTIGNETHTELWNYYSNYVKARGYYPTIKVGNQPYGILPFKCARPVAEEQFSSASFTDKVAYILAILKKEWLKFAENNVPRSPGVDKEEVGNQILRMLSMQPSSTSVKVRSFLRYTEIKVRERTLPQINPNGSTTPSEWLEKKMPIKIPLHLFVAVFDNNSIQSQLIDLPEVDNNIPDYMAILREVLHDPAFDLTQVAYSDFLSSYADKSDSNLQSRISWTVPKLPAALNHLARELDEFLAGTWTPTVATIGTGNSTGSGLGPFIPTLSLLNDQNLVYHSFHAGMKFITDLTNRSVRFLPPVSDLEPGYSVSNIEYLVSSGDRIEETGRNIARVSGQGKQYVIPALSPPFTVHMPDSRPPREVGDIVYNGHFGDWADKTRRQYINLFLQLFSELHQAGESEEINIEQEKGVAEALDLNSYRLDAWLTAAGVKQIKDDRATDATGIHLGAYGWLENLDKDTVNPIGDDLQDQNDVTGGIIHCPTSAQSITSAVSRMAYESYDKPEEGKANPFKLNLTSDRIQKALQLQEGIRQGQSLGQLLGYQLERDLHDRDQQAKIFELKNKYSVENNEDRETVLVIDGWKVLLAQREDNLQIDDIDSSLQKLEDTLDAHMDLLFFEASYQTMQGNLSQASAALNAATGKMAPPEIQSIKTRLPGIGLQHKLVMLFDHQEGILPSDNVLATNPKAYIEPVLEGWLKRQIGDLANVGCTVAFKPKEENIAIPESCVITLAELKIGYLDILYMSGSPMKDELTELELRIVNQAQVKRPEFHFHKHLFEITDDNIPDTVEPLSQFLEVCQYILNVLGQSEYLRAEDIASSEQESIEYDFGYLEELRERLDKCRLDLHNSGDEPFQAAKYAIQNAKKAFGPVDKHLTVRVRKEVDRKVELIVKKLQQANNPELNYYEKFTLLREGSKVLFGESFQLIPPFRPTTDFIRGIKADQSVLVGKSISPDSYNEQRIKTWVQGVAQVQPKTETFEDFLMVSSACLSQGATSKLNNTPRNWQFRVVQYPVSDDHPWVGLSASEMDNLENGTEIVEHYPVGSESIVTYAPQDIKGTVRQNESLYGLLVDQVVEKIPQKESTTGLNFQYNAPNTEPPQALLLATRSDEMIRNEQPEWTEDDLRDVVLEAMDLMKIRMVDTEAIEDLGFVLPMTYI
ncbi:hypothetical protein [Neolewinella sp.]|uniref:hypothetical protein n=1 Tax=Neolewinella sp. TaxID=2993543 RepID=UPI003B52D219